MRCCASYRISFHLYQSGLLGRVPQPLPRGNSLSQQVVGRAGGGPARIVPPDQGPVWMMEQDRPMTFTLLSGQSENIAAFEEVVPSGATTPLHIYRQSDEAVHVLPGELMISQRPDVVLQQAPVARSASGPCAAPPRPC